MKRIVPLLAALALCAGTASAQVPGNRHLQTLAVLPSGPGGGHEVFVVWTVELLAQASATSDFSTEVAVFVNGVEAGRKTVEVLPSGGSGPCGFGSCGSGCGGGSIDGVFATMLCLDEGAGGCGCRFPWITTPIPVEPSPGDTITAVLFAAPGSQPDVDPSDDRADRTFSGKPMSWNRKLLDGTLTPRPDVGPDAYDLAIEWTLETQGMAEELDVTPRVTVATSDGATIAEFELPCGPWIAAPSLSCPFCDNSQCGKITCNGSTVVDLRCRFDADGEACGCHAATSMILIGLLLPAVQKSEIEKGLTVELEPTPGALPELPPLALDDVHTPEVAGTWADVGHGLAGKYGVPSLVAQGTLAGGSPTQLLLDDALEFSSAWLVIGFSEANLPFKGGVMVPDPAPPALFVQTPTDFAGMAPIAFPWPAGVPSATSVWFQYWVKDPQGPAGFSATAGVVGTTP